MTPSHIDADAVEALCRHWFDRLDGHESSAVSHDDLIGSHAARLVGLRVGDQTLGTELGFAIGFGMAIQVAAAIASNPFGNNETAVNDVVNRARIEIQQYRDYA